MRKALLAGVVGVLLLFVTSPAWGSDEESHKVDICHRTASHSNPYVAINVDDDAVDGDGKQDHNRHEGPVWYEGIEGSWGDIIPPFYDDGAPGDWDSQNWTAEGIVIWENECEPVDESPSPSPSESPSPSPSESPSPSVLPSGADKCEGHGKDRPRCNETKSPPAALAFTGPPTSTVVIGSIALLLCALIGSGLLWWGHRRSA